MKGLGAVGHHPTRFRLESKAKGTLNSNSWPLLLGRAAKTKNFSSFLKHRSMTSFLQWLKKHPFHFSSSSNKILLPTMILNSPTLFLNSAEMNKISPDENLTRLENNGDTSTTSLSLQNRILVPKYFDINQGKYSALTCFHSLKKNRDINEQKRKNGMANFEILLQIKTSNHT